MVLPLAALTRLDMRLGTCLSLLVDRAIFRLGRRLLGRFMVVAPPRAATEMEIISWPVQNSISKQGTKPAKHQVAIELLKMRRKTVGLEATHQELHHA